METGSTFTIGITPTEPTVSYTRKPIKNTLMDGKSTLHIVVLKKKEVTP